MRPSMPDHYLARTASWQPAAPGQPRALGWSWWVCREGVARPMRGPYSEDDARRVLDELADEGGTDGA